MANQRRSFDYQSMPRLSISSLNRSTSSPRRSVSDGTRLWTMPALPRVSNPNTR